MGALNPKRTVLPDFRNKLQFCIHQIVINPFHISKLHSNSIWRIAHGFGTVRIREHVIGSMEAHDQEVCGLKWSPSGQQLASGGNDNLLHIWDAAAASSQGPSPYLHRLDDHQAAVKALAWCPFQSNLLTSGGGTADRCIKFWNTHTGACVNSIDTHSQVMLQTVTYATSKCYICLYCVYLDGIQDAMR